MKNKKNKTECCSCGELIDNHKINFRTGGSFTCPRCLSSTRPESDFLGKIDDLILIQTESVTDEYMRGLANGLYLAKSVYTGEDPIYLDPPEEVT